MKPREKKYICNRIDQSGCIVTGFEDVLFASSKEEAKEDYYFFLSQIEGIENPEYVCEEEDV